MKRDPRIGLGGIPRGKNIARRSQEDVRRKRPWKGKVDEGVYGAIHQLLDDLGFDDIAWWQIARSSDIPFRKEGRAIVAPGSWDEFIITAPKRGVILLTDINFYFPEPIGREYADITIRHPRVNDVNKIDDSESTAGSVTPPVTIHDTFLHYRFKVERGQSVTFRMENTFNAAQAIVDFSLIGRIIGGGYFPHQV